MCDKSLVEKAKENPKEKVFKILNVINDILSDMEIDVNSKYYKIEKKKLANIIIENNINLVKKEDIDKIAAKTQKLITIDEFNDIEKYYSILYDNYFLSKINIIFYDEVNLFRTINEAYYYKKFIKYISNFLKKYPMSLSDDIIKEKMFEVINCLNSDDKLYTYDFYFYLSIMHIKNSYKKNDILIPEFEPLNFEDSSHITFVFNEIIYEKNSVISCINNLLGKKYTTSQLMKYIKNVKDENDHYLKIIENLTSHTQIISSIDFHLELFTESEKNLIEYIKKNRSDKVVVKLLEVLEGIPDTKEKFEFYYMEKINKFLSLNKEHIYLIFHSYIEAKKSSKCDFYQHTLNYIEQIDSYKEGIKKDLKKEIKEIIENEDFFSLIHNIYNSNTIKDYCQNPVQYLKELYSQNVELYYEKNISSRKKGKNDKKYRIVSNFAIDKKEDNANDGDKNDNNEKDENVELDPNLLFEPLDNDDIKILNNSIDENDRQLELGYQYFMKNVFNENFFKDRIIFSYLPASIKGFVSNVPKIVLNVCGNNIITYKYKRDCDEFKIILKALLVCVIIHELIHMCRRAKEDKIEGPEKIFENDPYTPKKEDKIFGGGKSLIYHIFGAFVINYINYNFAKVIIDANSWINNGKCLKEKYKELGDDNKKKEKYVESDGGIKCYNSEIEQEDYFDDFNYYYCC